MEEKEKPSYLGHRERIKDKFLKNGLDGFMDHEVLELLLTYAIPRKDTKPTAWELIRKFGALSSVLDAPPEELAAVKGIGRPTAAYIKLLRGLLKRYNYDVLKKVDVIKSPQDVANYCRASLAAGSDEVFEVIYLTIRNTVIGTEILSRGAIDRASISPRKIIESALKARAVGIVLVHNHPSGDPAASPEDISFTSDVVSAAKVMGILVHDHIIVARGGFYSMRAKNKM